jgi:hypothetical protein
VSPQLHHPQLLLVKVVELDLLLLILLVLCRAYKMYPTCSQALLFIPHYSHTIPHHLQTLTVVLFILNPDSARVVKPKSVGLTRAYGFALTCL